MRREDSSIEECPKSESELGKKGSTKDGSVGKEGREGKVGLTRPPARYTPDVRRCLPMLMLLRNGNGFTQTRRGS